MGRRERSRLLASALAVTLGATGFAAGRWSRPAAASAVADENTHAANDAPAVAGDAYRVNAAATAEPAPARPPSFAALAASASPSVVNVRVVGIEKTAAGENPFEGIPGFGGDDSPFPGFHFPAPHEREVPRRGMGSGFIIRADGVILTNNHVVDNAKEITVTLGDKSEYPARVLGRDAKTDLAVLKIEPKHDLTALRLGDSDQLRVGDWVVAIGNPFGLSNTVTAGIVSAKERVIGAGPYDDFIQTDASINPGNSGGPLFDEHGDVVGINTAIFSQSGGNIGIGFAIPVNLAKTIVPELETDGHITRGWLGVSVQAVTPDLAKSLGLDEAHGALVADVTEDGPAARAGMKRGDVIVRYDGKAVDESTTLPSLVAATAVGKSVAVEVRRDGRTKSLDVKIAKLRDDGETAQAAPHRSKWGLALRDLSPQERARLGLKSDEGVLVTGVAPDSPAADAEIHPGDVILQANQTPVGSAEELKSAVAKASEDKPLLLLVHPSQGGSRFAALAAPKPQG